MPSIVEGFNNGIFNNHRQKDNRGDRWVGEFVEVPRLVPGFTNEEVKI